MLRNSIVILIGWIRLHFLIIPVPGKRMMHRRSLLAYTVGVVALMGWGCAFAQSGFTAANFQGLLLGKAALSAVTKRLGPPASKWLVSELSLEKLELKDIACEIPVPIRITLYFELGYCLEYNGNMGHSRPWVSGAVRRR